MSWKTIDREIGDFASKSRSAYWDTVRAKAKNKRALLVEGDDDKDVFEKLLDSIDPLWPEHVHVAVAGNRDRVLQALKDYADQDWYGLVDRDTWDAAQVADHTTKEPKLMVTTGWCLENHFCHPGELEAALGIPTGEIAPGPGDLDAWLRYGAIRWTLQRIRDDISKTLPSARWGHPTDGPFDDNALRVLLKEVSKVTPDDVFDKFNKRRQELAALPLPQQIELGIHGKELFREAVVPALNRALRQHDANRWRLKVATVWKDRWPVYLTEMAKTLLNRA